MAIETMMATSGPLTHLEREWSDAPLSQLEREWNECKTMEYRRNNMIDQLFAALAKADQENDLLKTRLEVYESSSTALISQKRQLEVENNHLSSRLRASPFVLVLIDGDATQFNDSFVQAGTAGGHQAAHGLKQALEQFMSNKLGLPSSTRIVVRVYFNAIGLKSAYVASGALDEGKVLWDFILGFNRELQLAEFVDAGQDKEAADHKIKANLDLFWHDENCRHILLACSADQGYVSHIRQYSNKLEDRQRLTLVESKPFPAAFKELAAAFGEIQTFNELFRTSHLVAQGRRPGGWAATAVQDAAPAAQHTLAVQATVPTPPQAVARPMRLIALNKKGQRINKPLLQYDGSLLPEMQTRNLCPHFHLTQCAYTAAQCHYSHKPCELSIEEKRLLVRAARTMVCPDGFACRNRDCLKGHHCLYDDTCHYKDTCKFSRAQHFVDKEIVKEI